MSADSARDRPTGDRRASASGTYLNRIIPDVVRRLEERKRRLPLAELEAADAPPARPSFAAAVGAPGVSLIAEVKRVSPSKGPIRPDLEVGAVVRAYEAAGAQAVSVLTEEDHFLGSLADLSAAAVHTRLPLLRKDFIVDPYQVYEARVRGASAILLIAALVDDGALRALAGLAKDLGVDVLLEVHDEAEMARALEVETAIIGINNRDLRTFEVSLDTTFRLAASVPSGRLLVGESGIRERADIERLALSGIDAVLVGEGILQRRDVAKAIHALMHPAPTVMGRSAGDAQRREAM